jgi:hypothetical protein
MTNLRAAMVAAPRRMLFLALLVPILWAREDFGADDIFQGFAAGSRADVDGGRAAQDPPTNSEANFNNRNMPTQRNVTL